MVYRFVQFGRFFELLRFPDAFHSILITLILFLPFGTSVDADEEISKVRNVKIPRFGEDGHLLWELEATEVKSKSRDIYFALNPKLRMYSQQELELTAQSTSGKFLINEGQASGKNEFILNGNGFEAIGQDWQWQNSAEDGSNQMIFNRKGAVTFTHGLGGFFVYSDAKDEMVCSPVAEDHNETEQIPNLVPTVAHADYMEFLGTGERTHRFLLVGHVSVEGSNLFLTCNKMEVLFNKEDNSTGAKIGKISSMEAVGEVFLKQFGRTSRGDRMTMDVKEGTVVLTGRASVVDEEWGEASGETVILEKGKERAKVLGGQGNRPRLELPPLPDFGFRKKSKAPDSQ